MREINGVLNMSPGQQHDSVPLPGLCRKLNIKIKDKTIKIIEMTAHGYSTKEIAEALFLTRRGVEYHLDIAKTKFGATNKSNLVFLATQNGCIKNASESNDEIK
ncbi:LuxR C-terminal-related transcriptional regulator [Ferrimonas sp. SCSIO 43195]|uniref:helix-turn-helix transcriptional regulator n=1 Tax=Ferrimonas sp. SCSIO 43195 TaxID=2822844 RepID=UPI002075E54F|nr:LuxR C-terminal-related transcriptional regulator [Ferrimonas sp. SCSIO 43195]USD36633.1 hypothetical protein J8Z22_16680 [Ferrimonas sp. SCSIO 43195]